ncbi:aspartate aminotransferase family protein [Rhizobium leguminosarum]|uniref:aspartate aminotransferase family protein n=1 Tax=Rhizobium leguminosarum TaxID=384 RepID=UPI00098F1050|nr:aminotransferase class III-fold pyridoxal phosphate-dependent enzyme [Rhizobium leguminosarum]ASS58102.1 aspartate aminotransferase family protein [Rhizobium leguminosarum bv. viciae]MBB4390036.1 glutamate-1-semialdehyde 2,1-aminomutase [Rhizobium leguminosarum]MBB4588717.1 glutamate-1-semialdehyde 2,1-aminomutase [Rhizobium leguminosarum]MBB5260457.1 glutamate-1-semialdehyde 2,1-aminomutase [Rhizobium leguminosarum]MBY5488386.1 aminotransferase class III-fold pyridoxal phosphate-dependent 
MTITFNMQAPWADDPQAKFGPRGFPLLPGGFGRSTYFTGATPTYAVKGSGCTLTDNHGRELIDANNNFTTLIHGVAHPEITEAAVQAISTGNCWGIPNAYEWAHAEALLSRFPDLDQVRYSNSGSEAVMTAIRLARAATGRGAVLMTRAGYHGSSDIALSTGNEKERRGIPKGVTNDVFLVDLNDTEGLKQTVEENPTGFAAIVIDLLPNRAGLTALTKDYVETARALASRHGIVLIVDEVISLRLHHGGYIGTYGVKPDLLTTGKLIGGGFPVGAMVGIEPLMRLLDPTRSESIPQAGTFSGNPVSMAAGTVALCLLTPDVIARMNRQGAEARDAIGTRIATVGWHVRGDGSLLRPFPDNGSYDITTQRKLWWAAYERGVLLSPANLASLSSAMSDAVVADIAERLADAVVSVATV